jgi:lipopolysaccharide transport system ATP-binding protein
MALGDRDLIVSKYLAAMAAKDSAYRSHETFVPDDSVHPAPLEVIETIPNIDHRFGDGRAEVLGIGAFTLDGLTLSSLQPSSTMVVRISVRAKANLDRPIVGFMFRNHLGVDFAGTNTAREGYDLQPLMMGSVCTVDFYLDLPALYASLFSFSPAVADGTLEHYSICDWIDNALVLPMERSDAPVYGQLHFPCRVQVNTKLGLGVSGEGVAAP